MSVTAQKLYEVCQATWPPAQTVEHGPFALRYGAGGGKRVSAASLRESAGWSEEALQGAEERMRAVGQAPLFMIREGEAALDRALDAAGYGMIDPVNMYVIDPIALTDKPIPRVTVFTIWEPLAIMRDIWAEGGIGPARVAVMERAEGPKTGLFGRLKDQPAAAGFVAVHDGIAMVHALEVRARHRRAGMGRLMMLQAAHWAGAQGAEHLAVICTQANAAANGLYSAMGFARVGTYHYRQKEET